MEQLQEGIKKDIIKHPFRNIEIIYEPGKTTLTPQDEELLTAYTRLHDMELQRKNFADNIFRESATLNERIETMHEELKKVQATFDACCTLADKLSAANYLPEETSLEKLDVARAQTEEELRDYNEKILAIYQAAKVLQEKIEQNNENDENIVEVLYDEVTNLAMDHVVNWESNSINSVVFDRQFNNFKEYRSEMESHREVLISSCEEVMTNYTNLNLQTTTLYNVWNEFIKRCDLLATMSDIHNKATGFTAN
jgi:hypothetical protein